MLSKNKTCDLCGCRGSHLEIPVGIPIGADVQVQADRDDPTGEDDHQNIEYSSFYHNLAKPVSGSILAELDKAAAKKRNPSVVEATHQADQHQQKKQTEHHPVWDFLQPLAICVLATITACGFLPKTANAVRENLIGPPGFGFKVAEFFQGFGLSDELVVLAVAMVPILEVHAAVPISFWLKLQPINGFLLAILGNMVPVPFILLSLEKVSRVLGEKSKAGRRMLHFVFERTREKASPLQEFQWWGLLLLVGTPLPGTGAWTGAVAAAILGMSFWESMAANFLGVLLAGLLVNVILTIGAEGPILIGTIVFVSSLVVWRIVKMSQKDVISELHENESF